MHLLVNSFDQKLLVVHHLLHLVLLLQRDRQPHFADRHADRHIKTMKFTS